MSDYPNPNLHRGSGVSGRGLLVAVAIVGFVLVLLVALGSTNAPPANEATVPAVATD